MDEQTEKEDLERFKDQIIDGIIKPTLDRFLDIWNTVKQAETLEEITKILNTQLASMEAKSPAKKKKVQGKDEEQKI